MEPRRRAHPVGGWCIIAIEVYGGTEQLSFLSPRGVRYFEYPYGAHHHRRGIFFREDKAMAVLRKAHKDNFTVIDNQVLRGTLSLEARGLLCTMLSYPDGLRFSLDGLNCILDDGRDSILDAIEELEDAGLLERETVPSLDGKRSYLVWSPTICL